MHFRGPLHQYLSLECGLPQILLENIEISTQTGSFIDCIGITAESIINDCRLLIMLRTLIIVYLSGHTFQHFFIVYNFSQEIVFNCLKSEQFFFLSIKIVSVFSITKVYIKIYKFFSVYFSLLATRSIKYNFIYYIFNVKIYCLLISFLR